ncbi:MAG: hypothetical protein HYW78_03760 [Parcubacteria group bacterium]|nr:hypothetical protein [Parcubacteria group bacterium]
MSLSHSKLISLSAPPQARHSNLKVLPRPLSIISPCLPSGRLFYFIYPHISAFSSASICVDLL